MSHLSLLFTRNNSLTSRLVRFFTRSHWSHVDIYDPYTGTVIGSAPGEGVREVPVNHILQQSTDYLLITYDNLLADRALAYARSKTGAGYDWLACLGFVTKAMLDNPTRYFCSELVSKAMAQAGCPIVIDEEHIKVSPDFISSLAGFGKLKIRREKRWPLHS